MKINTYLIILSLFIIFVLACSEEKPEQISEKAEKQVEKQMQEHSISESNEMVREGTIDVESIDKNEDGKIYECPMDWNVLDDNSGSCPVCGMDLKEYALTDIKSNLTKYGYEYKK